MAIIYLPLADPTRDLTAWSITTWAYDDKKKLLGFGFGGGTAGILGTDQARQLRDEINAFLGETQELTYDLWQRAARDLANQEVENKGLHDANEALRRDNDDLTRQKDRLIEVNKVLYQEARQHAQEAMDREVENEQLRQRVASLEKDNADLVERLGDTMQDRHNYRASHERLSKALDDLIAENKAFIKTWRKLHDA